MPAQLLVISAIAFTAVYLQIVLLLCPSAVAHECRRAGIVEQEVKLVALSRRLSAVKRAKEAAGPSVANGSNSPAALRIRPAYDLRGFSSNQFMVEHIQNTAVPTCLKVLEKFIQVRQPSTTNLLLPEGWNAPKCFEANIDPSTIPGQGKGVPNADYLLYVTSQPCTGGVLAYAGVCAVGGKDHRPIMGSMNLCPGAFDKLPYERQISVITHELLHALAFTTSLFPLYANGDPRTKFKGPYGQVTAITSPRVLQQTRQLFNCPTAVGALLEDEGNEGSTGCHWEARLFQGELMLASSAFAGRQDKVPRLQLTAALLEDTGWYLPRWDAIPSLDFGWQSGCQLLDAGPGAGLPDDLFCTPGQSERCTYDHEAIGQCFSSQGAGSNFMNGLGFSHALGATHNCMDASAGAVPAPMQTMGQNRGRTARCFNTQSPVVDVTNNTMPASAGCWDVDCDAHGVLIVKFRWPDGSMSQLPCPTGSILQLGSILPSHFKAGAIACPNNQQLCHDLKPCGPCVHGYCADGVCKCSLEYTGADCATLVTHVDNFDTGTPATAAKFANARLPAGSASFNSQAEPYIAPPPSALVPPNPVPPPATPDLDSLVQSMTGR
eukprot:jgi/Chrzof1/13565/Cz08g02100.t1